MRRPSPDKLGHLTDHIPELVSSPRIRLVTAAFAWSRIREILTITKV